MNDRNNRLPDSSVTIAMLISESVYKLVVIIERIYRWLMKAVIRPNWFLIRGLFGH